MKQTKMEGMTEWHLPKTDDSVVGPAGDMGSSPGDVSEEPVM